MGERHLPQDAVGRGVAAGRQRHWGQDGTEQEGNRERDEERRDQRSGAAKAQACGHKILFESAAQLTTRSEIRRKQPRWLQPSGVQAATGLIICEELHNANL